MKLKELLSADTDVVAGVIITVEGKILLCLRSKDGEWSIPKGHVQVSETPIQGALRELSEETDIQLHQDELELIDFGSGFKVSYHKNDNETDIRTKD